MSKAKKLIVPSIYVLSLVLIIGSIFLLVSSVSKYLSEPTDYDYGIRGVFEEITPVVNETTLIIRPYLSESVNIGKYFYDYQGEESEQENSLVYYENTYMQNSGVDYVSNTVFDVVSVLDGEIISAQTDEVLGNIVKIKHESDLISIYQGIDGMSVKKGDKVSQGHILGTSGTSKINPEYTSSVHFEIYYKGEIMDPENLYSLSIEDFR